MNNAPEKKSPEEYCSILSTQAGEPLYGSAARTEYYILLEYNYAWEDKALPKSILPDEVKQRLNELSKSLSNTKTLLIKRSSNPTTGPFHCFLCAASEYHPRLYLFQIYSYLELLDLDIPAILHSETDYSAHLVTDPLYLVCTNGRRDLCCSRFGYPIFDALNKLVGEAVWECTHIGGHRFAANLLHLPEAILYGRVQPKDVTILVDTIQSGRIYLENLRGRAIYPEAVQAGEYFLRQQTGELSLNAYRLVETIETEPGRWKVDFMADKDHAVYSLDITLQKQEPGVYDGCALDKQTPLKRFSLTMV
jgi:hypothetical protein